jgi:hypothetical protein
LATAIGGSSELDHAAVERLMFAAVTDHVFIDGGHTIDFTNKAFEALDHGAHDLAEPVLASLARSYATGERMEESNEWRNAIDLIAICERAFESIPAALEASGRTRSRSWSGREELASVILGEDPQAIADALLSALGDGASLEELAGTVVYAGALRIARFHISNVSKAARSPWAQRARRRRARPVRHAQCHEYSWSRRRGWRWPCGWPGSTLIRESLRVIAAPLWVSPFLPARQMAITVIGFALR